jgi:two-component system chemotaxis response regulator CheV
MDAPITGMVLKDDQIIQVIDLEDIIGNILNQNTIKKFKNNKKCDTDLSFAKILMADDSNIVRKIFSRQLVKAGFNNVTVCENGQEAYD